LQIATGLQSGQLSKVLDSLPSSARGPVGLAAKSAFIDGLDFILLVAAVIAMMSGVIALTAIRQRDFAQSGAPAGPGH